VGLPRLGGCGYIGAMIDVTAIRQRYLALSRHLDERARRIFAATEALTAGYGGIAAVSRATGIAASTIGRGLAELSATEPLAPGRVRRPGGGGKTLVEKDATLLADLMGLVEPDARGDPMSPLRWTCKSLSQLAGALVAMGHKIGRSAVGELLHQQKFSLQANRKTREGDSHPDRDAQFAHLNASVRGALAVGEPVISVDTKKKELVGDFKNAGRTWRPRGAPEDVRVHDFLIEELGRAAPYGVYDLAANAGWVSVGMNNDTAAFAVQTIRRWWRGIGQQRYPNATRLTITAEGGGSNASRSRLWKVELHRLASEIGIDIVVHHLPPGTSKWNKIEHRLFSFITMNWKATPLVSYRVIVDLIAATTTKTGLTVTCELDSAHYPKGVVVPREQMDAVRITRDAFHGDWNYTIHPHQRNTEPVEAVISG
jgi:Rhodopirellula transposase DDE domain